MNYLILIYTLLNLNKFRKTFPDGHRLVMDNDPKHRSKETAAWFLENDVNHWETPPQSPV